MSMTKWQWPRKAVAVFASAALVSTMMVAPVTAYADEASDQAAVPTSALSTTDASGASYVTGFIVKRPTPIFDILGISAVNEGNLSFDDDAKGYGESYPYDSTWVTAKYWLIASSYNSNPSPFIANYGTGLGDASNTATTSGNIASSYISADEDVQATWDLQPDIIYNFTSSVTEPVSQYLLDEEGDVLEGFEDYDPEVINYSSSSDATWEGVLGNLTAVAKAADAIVEESDGTKVLRYGSAMDIVESYEQYIYGSLGYVAESIDDGSVAKRTYASVTSVTDNGDGSYTWGLEASGLYNQTMPSAIAYDLIDALGVEATEVTSTNSKTGKESTSYYYYVSTEELDEADLVVCTGGANNETIIEALEAAGLMDKSYVTLAKSNEGCIFNSIAGVEVPQNIGRILGCLYPELIDQDNWLGYYLQNYYHVNASDVPYVLSKVFVGVTNWDAADSNGDGTLSYDERVTWSEADGEDYNEADVQAAIDEGYAYYCSLSDEEVAYLNNDNGDTKYENEADKTELNEAIAEANATLATVTDETASEALAAAIQNAQAVSNDGTADEDAVSEAISTLSSVVTALSTSLEVSVEAESYEYTGASIEPAVTVVNGMGATLTQGSDYTVVYTNNVLVGTATVYVIGAGDYAGVTATATFEITAVEEDVADDTNDATDGTDTGEDATDDATDGTDTGDDATDTTDEAGDDATDGTDTNAEETVTEGFTVAAIDTQHWTGSAIEPTLSVTSESGTALVEGTDCVAIYTNNVETGTATVYVVGLGTYTGVQKVTFTIDELTLSGTTSYSKRVTSAAFALAVTATEGATLAYSSSDEGVATVSAAGKVTVAGKGSATITVTASKDGYASVSMQVAVKVAKPAAPTLKSVKSSKKRRVTVKAAGSAKVTGYQVWYKVAGKKAVKVKVKGSTAKLSKTIKKLASGKKCTVKVRAYKKLNSTTCYSAWSAKKSVKVK